MKVGCAYNLTRAFSSYFRGPYSLLFKSTSSFKNPSFGKILRLSRTDFTASIICVFLFSNRKEMTIAADLLTPDIQWAYTLPEKETFIINFVST